MISTGMRELVRQRAADRCEYCLLRQEHTPLTHHVEHIIARKHGGSDEPDNLALACQRCNLRKGPNLTGIDPVAGEVVALFHPRRHRWEEHFRFDGDQIQPLSAIGPATVDVLALNEGRRVEVRRELLIRGELR